MTAPNTTHLIIFEPPPDDDLNTDDYRLAFVCPGVSDSCRFWQECYTSTHDHAALETAKEDDGEYEGEVEGVWHRYLDGSWMTRTDNCIVTTTGHESGDYTYLMKEAQYVPGAYAFAWEWDEGIYFTGLTTEEVPDPEKAMEVLPDPEPYVRQPPTPQEAAP